MVESVAGLPQPNMTSPDVMEIILHIPQFLWYSWGNTSMEQPEQRKLYRSNTNKVFAGICGGLGEYFDVDPTVIRLFWLLMVIFSGVFPGLIAYILAMLLVPRKP